MDGRFRIGDLRIEEATGGDERLVALQQENERLRQELSEMRATLAEIEDFLDITEATLSEAILVWRRG